VAQTIHETDEAHMRGDEPDEATVQLCLLPSGWPSAAALGTAVSDWRLSAIVAQVGVDESVPAAARETSPTDAAAEAAVSVFLADKSITSGSHNFFTWCITPAHTLQQYHIKHYTPTNDIKQYNNTIHIKTNVYRKK